MGGELLEREAELGALAGWLDRCRGGSGGVLLIESEAGGGKTALLERASELASERRMRVLVSRGGELEREFSWGIVRQLFEPWLADRAAEAGSALFSGSAELAAPVFSRDAVGKGGPEESFATLHGLYWLAASGSREAPVLLVVDDIHWSDRPSLRFLAHLAPRLEGLPIGLLASLRPVGSEPASDTELLARLLSDPAAEHLQPAPLSPGASAELVRGRLNRSADDEFCRVCHEMSRGNPFLLGALIAMLRAEQIEPTAEGARRVRRMTPSAVTGRVLVRLATLPDGCVELARALAVLEPRTELQLVRRVAGLEAGLADRAADALVRAGIVRGGPVSEFVHPLVRSAVYGDFAPVERARWHARAAQLQLQDGATSEEVAPHLLASLPEGDQDTVTRLREAAVQARARSAPELAVDYLARALEEPPAPQAKAGVLLELGAAEALQHPERAIDHLRQALASTRTPGGRAEVALALGDALAASGRPAEAIEVLQAGVAESAGGDGPLPGHLTAALLATARWEPAAQPLRRRTVRALRDRLDGGERLDPLLLAQLALESAAAGTDRTGVVELARQVLGSAPELTFNALTLPETALLLTFSGLPEEAWGATQTCLARARRLGWPLGVATASTCAALTALHLGWISESLASARGAITPGADVPLAPITLAFLIEAMIERGDTAAAQAELADRGLDGRLPLIWPTTPLLLARGRLRAALGDHRAAIDDLLATGERTAAWGVENPAMSPWRSSAAVSLAALRRTDEAVELAQEELRLSRRWGAKRAIGVALRGLGLAHGGAEGLSHLQESVQFLGAADDSDGGAPLERARSLIELGSALRRTGARSDAREPLRVGMDLAHRCGALALAERAREELVIAGARPRRAAISGRDALTSSELRVATLAAAGHTNNEIAQLLFVTQRTVETHLTSSYAKLGIHARRQLPDVLGDPPTATGA